MKLIQQQLHFPLNLKKLQLLYLFFQYLANKLNNLLVYNIVNLLENNQMKMKK